MLDFGLARRSVPSGGSSRSGLDDLHGGTLNYMSPEQIHGEAPSAASDIFSLGIVLWELVTGRHPFRAATPLDTAHAIVHGEPVPPVPSAFGSLLAAMVRKDPALRPTAREVEQILSSMPSAAPTGGKNGGGRRWAIALALCLAAAGAGFWAWRTGHAQPTPLVLTPLTRFADKSVSVATLSPDAYVVASPGGHRIAFPGRILSSNVEMLHSN